MKEMEVMVAMMNNKRKKMRMMKKVLWCTNFKSNVSWMNKPLLRNRLKKKQKGQKKTTKMMMIRMMKMTKMKIKMKKRRKNKKSNKRRRSQRRKERRERRNEHLIKYLYHQNIITIFISALIINSHESRHSSRTPRLAIPSLTPRPTHPTGY